MHRFLAERANREWIGSIWARLTFRYLQAAARRATIRLPIATVTGQCASTCRSLKGMWDVTQQSTTQKALIQQSVSSESTDTAERQQRNPFEEPSVMNFTVAGLTGQPWTARDVLLGDVFFCSGYVECIVSEYVGSAVSIFPTVLTTCTSW